MLIVFIFCSVSTLRMCNIALGGLQFSVRFWRLTQNSDKLCLLQPRMVNASELYVVFVCSYEIYTQALPEYVVIVLHLLQIANIYKWYDCKCWNSFHRTTYVQLIVPCYFVFCFRFLILPRPFLCKLYEIQLFPAYHKTQMATVAVAAAMCCVWLHEYSFSTGGVQCPAQASKSIAVKMITYGLNSSLFYLFQHISRLSVHFLCVCVRESCEKKEQKINNFLLCKQWAMLYNTTSTAKYTSGIRINYSCCRYVMVGAHGQALRNWAA